MVKKQPVQFIRDRENHMEVWHRQQILFAAFDPGFALCVLAFGAMTVAAGVITYADMTALVAFVHMSAHGRCTATQQGAQGSFYITVGCMLLVKLLPEPFNDICQFEGRFQALAYNLSNGLNRLLRLGLATCRYISVVSIRS